MFLKFRIKTKILFALLLLSGITFATISYLTMTNMQKLGEYTSEASARLGENAVRDSKQALLTQAREELQTIAVGQAMTTEVQLKRISAEINVVAELTRYYLEAGGQKIPEKTIDAMVSATQPEKPEDAAVFNAAPGSDEKILRQQLLNLGGIIPLIKFVFANNANHDMIYLGFPDGLFIGYPWNKMPETFDHRQRVWYKKAVAHKKLVWAGPYVSTVENMLVLTCAKPVYDSKGKLLAVCAIDLKVELISKNFISSELDPEGYAFMIDSKGNVLARNGMEAFGANWDNTFEKENLTSSDNKSLQTILKKMMAHETGIGILKLQGDSYRYVAFAPIETTGWSVGVMMPRRVIIAPALKNEALIQHSTQRHNDFIASCIRKNQTIYFSVGMIILAGIIILGYALADKITGPITLLQRKANHIGMGELNTKIELNTGDELQSLAETFNKMTEDLKRYIKNLKQTITEKEKIEKELAVATEIQASMLPRIFPPFPQCDDIDIFAIMEPAREVGGDFYDFSMLNNNQLFFCIGDVSGKGVPAALFMAITKTLLDHEAHSNPIPQKILQNVNNALEKDNETCMFATVFCGRLNMTTGEVTYSNAGHNPPLLYSAEKGSFEYLRIPSGIAIGPCPMTETTCAQDTFTMQHGDILFLYSDGITEAMNANGDLYSEARLKDELNSLDSHDLDVMLRKIRSSIRQHAGEAPQSDDITMLAIKFTASPKIATI